MKSLKRLLGSRQMSKPVPRWKPGGRNFRCLDCHRDVQAIGEYYFMLRAEIWDQIQGGRGMLCVGCVEKRLGRTLRPDDFSPLPINTSQWRDWRSERLEERLGN